MTLPPLSLDRSAGALSRQLYDSLRDAILSGQFRVGTRMPSTRALAASLSVSRNTVHMAFEQLILEGLLEGKQGAGTFVAQVPSGIPLGPDRGALPDGGTFSAALAPHEAGIRPATAPTNQGSRGGARWVTTCGSRRDRHAPGGLAAQWDGSRGRVQTSGEGRS